MSHKISLLLKNILTALFLSAFSLVNLEGQNYTIRSYTTSQGLPHNNVRTIARDSSGFLWLGTWDGLSRFDGYEFRNYFHKPDDTTSIPFFSINELLVDKENVLWLLTDTRELVKYNRQSDNFTTIREMAGIKPFIVNGIAIDPRGYLTVIISDKLIRIESPYDKVEIFQLSGTDEKPYFSDFEKNWISFSGDSTLWLTTRTVKEFRKTGQKEYTLVHEYQIERRIDEPVIFFDTNIWREVYGSLSGNKWLFSNNGLYFLDEKEGIFREFQGDFPKKEFTGRKYFFYAKRNKGLFYFNTSEEVLTYLPDQKTRWATTILPGGKNNFWYAGISEKGVAQGASMVTLIPGYFKNTLIPSPDSTSPAVYAIVADRNKDIWTGIRGYDHIEIFTRDGSVRKTDLLSSEVVQKAGHIRSLVPVPDGIWIGYFYGLLKFYDYETGSFTIHSPGASIFRAVAALDDGRLCIGTDKLILYDPSTRDEEIVWRSQEATGMFRIFADTSGIIWGGMSDSKLLRYNITDRKAEVIKVARGTSNIEDIVQGDNGDLWLALLGKGVCRYNTADGSLKYYTTALGLSNNTTYCILKDKNDHIWVSTNHGISMIHPESDHVRIFDETDGIAITEFNSGAKFIAADGEFFFGGMGGFIRFYPDSINLDDEQKEGNRILLTGFEISGESIYAPTDLNKNDTIILLRNQNNFHINFSSTDFVNSERIVYRYMLSGVDRKWIETSHSNRNINYSNLKPGWYRLTIQAAGQDGSWGATRIMTIRIKPSFYQTRIFKIISPLLLLFIITFSIVVYIWQIKQKERSKQDELKLQSLRSQMNPHFIFNSLNSINYFISNNDKLSANRYIADFSRLIRSILSNMDSNFISFENEINSIKDYLRIEHLRFSDKFEYSLDTSEIIDSSETEVCPGIVQPFIENAIWHGVRPLENRKGIIRIKFVYTVTMGIRCIIEDDGIGRAASLKNKETNSNHKPKGIGIITERLLITGKLRRTNYTLEISDLLPGKKETGTRVEVDIPSIIKKYEQNDKSLSGR